MKKPSKYKIKSSNNNGKIKPSILKSEIKISKPSRENEIKDGNVETLSQLKSRINWLEKDARMY